MECATDLEGAQEAMSKLYQAIERSRQGATDLAASVASLELRTL